MEDLKPMMQLQYVTGDGNLKAVVQGSLDDCLARLDEDSKDGMPEHQIVSVVKEAILFKEEKA